MSRFGLLLRALVATLMVVLYVGTTPAQAATVEVTVHLYRVVELSCDEGAGEACGNDYYPKFEIDHQGLFDGRDDFCCAHGSDFRTNWVRKVNVDTSHNPVAIHLELWDQDDLSQDDVIHWAKTGDYLDLDFNLDTCVFTGGGLTAQQGAGIPSLAGESETSGPDSARGYFTITTPHCLDVAKDADSDNDGLLNTWETPGQGYNINGDDKVDLALGDPPYNALPYRKDLFVEADAMTGFAPQPGALDDVVKAFADAPVDPYPDPADATKTKYRGVNLHTAVDESNLPVVSGILFQTDGTAKNPDGTDKLDDFNDLKNAKPRGPCTGHFGTVADRADSNCEFILKAKRDAFRYMIFGDTHAENLKSSGISEWAETAPHGGNDFMVTLGAIGGTATAILNGRRNSEAATFMHEFGHTLGLGHGGGDYTNCKPNYLSVMNYTLQFTIRDPARPLDYSSAVRGTDLPRLDEAHLNENNGVRGTPNPARNTVYGVNGKVRVAPATNGALDWNEKNGIESDIPADINYIESIKPADKYGCAATSPNQPLDGFDDWANLQYNPRLNGTFFLDGARGDLPEELTEDTILAMAQKADLKVTKSADQAEATGGDTVGYTVNVTDLGPDTAKDISLTDTLPDGTKQQRSLPDLANGAVNTVTPKFTYQVPCDTTDGTTLTNTVTVTGNDANGIPDPYVSDNTAKATTTVQAPVLTVGATATATVNAGEAITYRITYANTGGGAASHVALTTTLPAGLYYSQALDLGSGPKPTTVTRNADGTTTLTWAVNQLPATSGDRTIVFTARPTLLALAGTTYTAAVSVAYQNATGACTYAPVTAAATTTITVVPPTRDPLSKGFWKNHQELWTAENLARVQATDQRYDTDGSGALSAAEITAAFRGQNEPKSVLSEHLLGTYFNLATRRINAGTVITDPLGLGTVRGAALYAQDTLALPVDSSTASRYSGIIGVLDDVNANKIETY
ncbi:DUF11 domain-containing protein [Nonomuraea sediminis]|uniref:DUF11 domain-containing protein n=1 Tax=Nonomuraea sediminis TaxID=2835864 RepID=UPI001BDC62A4|nr:DUF11 domain-containing protein [Nonomuraea sediminis]